MSDQIITQQIEGFDVNSYDHYIVAFSGGKDSLACLLWLLEQGIPAGRIELWHHLIDGPGAAFMDWPVTEAYCKAVALAFGCPIYFSWKKGGFKGEMLRENALTAPMCFETPNDGVQTAGGKTGKLSTRRKFPQVSADLTVRWCSAYLKIDVASSALRNQPRFKHSRTLVLSGERAEESTSRAKYNVFEPDRADRRNGENKRHIDRLRPIHKWSEVEVWAIIERWKVNPHPAYHLGWGRCSCMFCIFGSPNQWASAKAVNPAGLIELVDYEADFGRTPNRTKVINQDGLFELVDNEVPSGYTLNRNETITERADRGTAYTMEPAMKQIAMATEYTQPVFVDDWQLPAGAFGESCGPV